MIISSKKVTVMKAADVASIMREVLQAESEVDRGREHFCNVVLGSDLIVDF